jgi:hypothetical protein
MFLRKVRFSHEIEHSALETTPMPTKADAGNRRRSLFHEDFAFATFCNHIVRVCDLVESKPPFCVQRFQLILLREFLVF